MDYRLTPLKVITFILFFHSILWGASSSLEKVTLQLQWKYQFQFAGFIVAKEYGFYQDVGLDVEILEYNNSNIIEDLENGVIDFGLNNSIIAYHNKRLNDVTLLASYFQRSPLILVTQPEIKSMIELEGKKVMMSEGNRYNSSLTTLLDYFNLNNEKIDFLIPSFDLEDFIDKKVDAITAFRSNELYELDKRGIQYNIIDPVSYGFSTNAINLFCASRKVKENPQQIDKFLKATQKGWKYALSHKQKIATLIHNKYQSAKSINHLIYEAERTEELMLSHLYNIGEINEAFVLKTFNYLIRQKKIDENQTKNHLFIKESLRLKLKLSQKEKDWIEAHQNISFTGDPHWMPYESFDDNGNYQGIVSEHLKLIEKMSGLSFTPLPVTSWSQALDMAMRDKVKVISGDSDDIHLKQKFNPVDSYNHNPVVIVMDTKQDYVEDLSMIADKKIAIIKNYGYTTAIYKRYPQIKFREVTNIAEGLKGIVKGDFDAMVSTMTLASYTIRKQHLYTLKIVGKTPIMMYLTLFVSKDEPILHSIINKTLHAITPEQKYKIVNQWLKHKVDEKKDYQLLWSVSAVFIVLLSLVMLWNYRMRIEIKKRERLEKDNQEIHQRLSYALNGSNDGLWDWNLLTNDVYYAPRWKEILGYKEEEIENEFHSWEILMHPEDLAFALKEVYRYIESQDTSERFSLNFRMQHKEGHYVPLLSRAKKVYNLNGDAVRMVGTHVDLTKLIKVQEAYKRERDKGELYLDTVDVLIVALDIDGRVTMLNRKGEELLEYKEEEILGKNWFELEIIPEDISSEKEAFFSQILSIKEKPIEIFEHALITKSGKELLFSFHHAVLFDSDNACIGLLSSGMDITALKKAQETLVHQAQHDALTDLPNRLLFIERLNHALIKQQSTHFSLAVLFIDLDHFKEINDSLGHNIGDLLLQEVAERFKRSINKGDMVARQGGDEFTLVLDNIRTTHHIITIIEKMNFILKEPFMLDGHQLYVTMSIGVALSPQHGTDADSLLKNADIAMYKAKKEGRDNYQFYTEDMSQKALERLTLETQLRHALENNEMKVYYQAQVDARDSSLIGMEALLRWHHPQRGIISPTIFIPLAEETGFIIELDEWIMKEALAQFKIWYEQGLNPGILSLNLSILRLEHKDFIDTIKEIIKQSGITMAWLNLEVTEGQIMQNPHETIKTLNRLNALGIKLAIDDFGTGYSSLSYLTKFPISKLKIDQSFVQNLHNNSEDAEIVKVIIAMAKGLNLSVIAEGVETTLQRDFLLEYGCYEIQGFLYHKPSNAKEIEEMWLTSLPHSD